MLTNNYLATIGKTIEEIATFKRSDFKLNVNPQKIGGADLLTLDISYLYEPRYRFVAKIPGTVNKYNPIAITNCPGEVFDNEQFGIESTSMLLPSIRDWLKRVQAEIKNIPIQRELEQQQQQIQDILTKLEDLPNEYFSREEGDSLKQKLDELEARLVDNLKNSEKQESEVRASVAGIVKDMNVLKENIATMNKRSWAGAFTVRALEWLKDPMNRKVLKSGAEVAKDLLLEAGKHIPDGQ